MWHGHNFSGYQPLLVSTPVKGLFRVLTTVKHEIPQGIIMWVLLKCWWTFFCHKGYWPNGDGNYSEGAIYEWKFMQKIRKVVLSLKWCKYWSDVPVHGAPWSLDLLIKQFSEGVGDNFLIETSCNWVPADCTRWSHASTFQTEFSSLVLKHGLWFFKAPQEHCRAHYGFKPITSQTNFLSLGPGPVESPNRVQFACHETWSVIF